MEESAIFICNTANKLKKSDKPAYYSNNSTNTIQQTNVQKQEEQTENAAENFVEEIKETTDKDYISVVKKVKKENITENNIGEIMLCQIPGVSSVTAIAIMEKFKTIPNLMKEIELSTSCLKDISYTNAKGQTRKITKTSVANIVKFLFRKEM